MHWFREVNGFPAEEASFPCGFFKCFLDEGDAMG